MKRLFGIVRGGKNDANRWLSRFAGVYSSWLGRDIFPGSLNIDTDSRFDWHSPEIAPFRRRFSLTLYGGARDLFMVPCAIVKPGIQICWLWTTTTAADDRTDPSVVELIAAVNLRGKLGLADGMRIEVEYPLEWNDNKSESTR